MKTRNASPKSRPVLAILLVAATVFLLAGRTCGVVGALLSASVTRLLGDAGTALLCATTWCIAFILATPSGTFTRMVVTVWHAVKPRRSAAVVVTRAPAEPAPAADVDTHPMPTRDRRTLTAVRDALKGLGYHKSEYEAVVAGMDPSLGFEKLVKTALKHLQVN
jgi:hypothetical protein